MLKELLSTFIKRPPVPNLARGSSESFYPAGLTMGTLVIGRPGTGKTTAIARHIIEYRKRHPHEAIFVMDWSQAITDSLCSLILNDQYKDWLIHTTVYDEPANDFKLVVPFPEFHPSFGPAEEQAQRVATNMEKLSPMLVSGAPFVAGIGLKEIGPNFFRLAMGTTNTAGQSFQITDIKRLLVDGSTRASALKQAGASVPGSKWFIEKIYNQWSDHERDLRTYALLGILGAVETPEIRARIGYPEPGWTVKEAIEKGLLVIVNGARLINQPHAQHYLFMQVFSQIMAELNRRTPGNPSDVPVSLVMDEVYTLLQIPGMAEEIGKIATIYRSRKLQLYVIIQALWQLSKELRQQIFSLGNVMSFGIQDFNEAYEVAQQLFPYAPGQVKLEANVTTQHPLMEADRGQYLQAANWLQRLTFRECVMRRYKSERVLDPYILHVGRTAQTPPAASWDDISQLKHHWLSARGVPLTDALKAVNTRDVSRTSSAPPTA